MRLATSYIPHTLYAIAVTSISIHLVSERKSTSEELSRINARISILESIADQLRLTEGGKHTLASDGLDRLKRLARLSSSPREGAAVGADGKVHGAAMEQGTISWKEVVFGRKRESDELSSWEKKDLEKLREEANKP
ncbi:hypothetical protein AMATHDRAFT_87761 [Amanita thiersii Skay4041]|uniref:Uncharacterized protein n=1 Tax=Amanita thiersii Skay4041 TaxID=703135 RepID=A0A2A9NHY3_9AGAR|nr:hypothetical protein AMATHDRAFT_87761 [Amanita thiersii Skay4041]